MDKFLMNTHFSLAWVSLSDYSKRKFKLMHCMLKIICNAGRKKKKKEDKQCLISTSRPMPWPSWKSLGHL